MTREEAMDYVLNPAKAPAAGSVEHQEFLAFLDESPDDRRLYEEQAALFNALDVWQPVEPSAGFDRSLLQRIEQQRPWYAGFLDGLFAVSPRFAAAAAALVLAAGLMLDQRPAGEVATKVALSDPAGEMSQDFFSEIDRGFEDLEMLADFDALTLELRPDRS